MFYLQWRNKAGQFTKKVDGLKIILLSAAACFAAGIILAHIVLA